MSKRHKIPASRLVKIPHALTPMRPQKGEFMQEAARAELLARGVA